jgi:hypothetical protein
LWSFHAAKCESDHFALYTKSDDSIKMAGTIMCGELILCGPHVSHTVSFELPHSSCTKAYVCSEFQRKIMMVYTHVCYIGVSHVTCSVVEKHTYGTHLWRAAIFLTGSLIARHAHMHLHVQWHTGRKNSVGIKQMTDAKKKKTNAFITC